MFSDDVTVFLEKEWNLKEMKILSVKVAEEKEKRLTGTQIKERKANRDKAH